MAEDKKYIETVGRRKTSVARVRLTEASKMSYVINDRELADYFPTAELQRVATEVFTTAKVPGKFKITAVIKGGGVSSQAVAFRHGIARAINEYDKEMRPAMKKAGFLKRDPRAKERRKFGLKKARKAPQWSKR
jgi:small subunit ribosomal protein S9